MSWREDFTAMMSEYDEAVREVQKNRKIFDGVFGMGTHPGNAPCHDVLDRKIEALCREAAEEPDAGQIREMLEEIYAVPLKWQGPEYAKLMLIAVQRHTMPLISRLAEEDRAELSAWYQKTWPRRRRLPLQEEVLKALQKGD